MSGIMLAILGGSGFNGTISYVVVAGGGGTVGAYGGGGGAGGFRSGSATLTKEMFIQSQ